MEEEKRKEMEYVEAFSDAQSEQGFGGSSEGRSAHAVVVVVVCEGWYVSYRIVSYIGS